MKENYYQNIEYPSWFNARPLVYDPKLSQYPPNTPISMIVKEIMIEKWNPSYSYNRFYELCSPSYCTYSQRIRAKSIFGVILTLVSVIGGLTVALRLITPTLVKLILNFLTIIIRRRQQQQQQSGKYSFFSTLNEYIMKFINNNYFKYV
jgi:hypothetical protein